MSPEAEPSVPFISDRYRIERELGSGGMAIVYLAKDLKHDRHVAVKVMKDEIARVVGRDRFLREIEIAARLNHPHVLPLFDSGAAGETLYYVMPRVNGESLRSRLDREKQLPVEDALRITREVASALAHAHKQGIVHRDIKPENVLLADGIALVADFGIARAMSAAAGHETTQDETTQATTRTVGLLGTPTYMSPEQASGEEIDGRTDLYALACVLFEMLAGQPPFVAPTLTELIRMHLVIEARAVTELRPAVSNGLSSVIAKGLAKLRADRYPTAARFAEALGTAVDDSRVATHVRAVARSRTPHNLKRQSTRFIGREKERTECAQLLEEARLLTLTGIGGCGKTRLALALAEDVLTIFPDGVWFVDLAPLTEAGHVADAVAAPLGVREQAGKDLTDALCEHVRGKRVLLILDNCEHLLSACAALSDKLLGAGEDGRILATSREGLGVEGERLYAVRSLGVPSASARDRQAVEASEAVKLFVDRAKLALSEFSLTEINAASVGEICRRLDGIPLAIELAAARVKILSVDQIRAKLNDRFRLLSGGTAALPRHQTLRATIQWSYDHLSIEEQRLFQALSAFAGGWTLDSATLVAGEDSDEFEVMNLLARLVDKSLVLVERERDMEPRYGLLETVRQHGMERLAESGEGEAVRSRHFEAFLALAERAYPDRFVTEEKCSAALEAEHDNLRVALEFARTEDAERYLQLAGTIAWFWQVRSHFLDGREHLSAALAATPSDPPRPARARALWGAANILAWQGDAEAARPLMDEALRMWRALEDMPEVALALEGTGWSQLLGGDDETACATFEECLRLQREGGDRRLINRAMVALAQVLVALGRVEEARPMASEIIAFAQAHDDRRSEHFGWHYLADCALIEGRCEESLELYRQSLVLAQALGDRLETSFELQGVAMSLAGLGRAERAILLAASAEAERQRLGVDPHMRFWDALLDRYLGGARRALDAAAADRVRAEGLAVPFDEAVSVALRGDDA